MPTGAEEWETERKDEEKQDENKVYGDRLWMAGRLSIGLQGCCRISFEICAGVLRTKERARQVADREKIFATEDLEEALKQNPDFCGALCCPEEL